MKTYEILLNSSSVNTSPEIQHYLHNRIEQIGRDYKNVERCEVVLQQNTLHNATCEVKVRLFVPRHVYSAYVNSNNFRIAAEMVFDDLSNQLLELKERMTDNMEFSAKIH